MHKVQNLILSSLPEISGKTRDQLLTLHLLPDDLPKGIIGKYHHRVKSAEQKSCFCSPQWKYADTTLVRGPYTPKTKRGIFDFITQTIELLGEATGEQLCRFIHDNIDLRQQRSPYTEGQPVIPWIEDYITGAIAPNRGYLTAKQTYTPDDAQTTTDGAQTKQTPKQQQTLPKT